jgi:serine/threonine protein phosphatase PrpC
MTKPRPPLEIASLTDAGMVRSHNEDNHAADAQAGFVILADGMGGYNAGEVASEMAVAQLSAGLRAPAGAAVPPADRLRRLIEQVNTAIHYAARTREQCAGMGTTLVAALFRPGWMTVAHVGDSRLYRLRGERFEVITRDHSVLQEQIDGGLITLEEARLSHHKNLVTRALGVEAAVAVEVADYETLPRDLYLLCSDGLNDMADDDAISQVLRAHPDDLTAAAAQLVALANRNGGRDNVTVILARVLAEPAEPGMLARLSGWIRHPA